MIEAPPFAVVGRVLRQLPEELEARVHVAFRRAGGSTSRWGRRDWSAMAGALTALEDWLEAERPRFDRSPLRDVRRALEVAEDVAEASRRAA
jgi:hypothetical protein